jgi:hypothetical protein
MFVRVLQAIPQLQADKPKGQQAAEFSAALSGGHAIGGQGVGVFHHCARVIGRVHKSRKANASATLEPVSPFPPAKGEPLTPCWIGMG